MFDDRTRRSEADIFEHKVRCLKDVLPAEHPFDAETLQDFLNREFGADPIPEAVVNAALESLSAGLRPALIRYLAELRGEEVLPWVNGLLQSDDKETQHDGISALLWIDEGRGLRAAEQMWERDFEAATASGGEYVGLLTTLSGHESAASAALANAFMLNINVDFPVAVRYI